MIQQLVDHQEKLTQDLNLQLANTMQENFSQAINMLHDTDINSESLASTQQKNNFSDTIVTNAQLLTSSKLCKIKLTDWKKKPSVNIDNNSIMNPRTGKPFKRYCFSCGYCQHWGENCLTKKSGHQNDATFKNRMGGSNDNCMPNRT